MNRATNISGYAWAVVALLWPVAMLNYLDRQMLATIRTSIRADMPSIVDDQHFGALMAVFMWVYAFLSPVGGYVADKINRRVMVIASLFVWSAVTWATGHAQTYSQMLTTRACMGISEAFYMPAALALITDFHTGGTRAKAVGIHQSGIYAGLALGGIGGYIALNSSWRHCFTWFGIAGVIYSLVLMATLRDAPATPRADGTKKVCEDCAFNAAPRPEWTPNGKGILYSAEHNQVNILQPASGQRIPLLNSRKLANLYTQFSHDGQWLTIGAFAPDGTRKIFTARVRNGVAASENEWIPVHENVVSAEFPQWSPDDNMVYFFCYHEGAECICAHHLDALSKRPVDSTFAVYRFTNARFSGNSWGDFSSQRMRELAVAADKLVFSQTEQTGNVWMIKLPAN